VLSGEPYSTLRGVLVGLLAPLAGGASIVLCRSLDPALLPERAATERVTILAATLPDPASQPNLRSG
jgi:hypothetical protein